MFLKAYTDIPSHLDLKTEIASHIIKKKKKNENAWDLLSQKNKRKRVGSSVTFRVIKVRLFPQYVYAFFTRISFNFHF